MIYLAIVGTSHLSESEELDARKRIIFELRKWQIKIDTMTQDEYQKFINYDLIIVPKQMTLITGDAKGIDTITRQVAQEQGYSVKVYEAERWGWESFKKRNIDIATAAHYVISITTQTKKEKCYHCNENHQRSGGCWTRKYAFDKFGTPGETIVI